MNEVRMPTQAELDAFADRMVVGATPINELLYSGIFKDVPGTDMVQCVRPPDAQHAGSDGRLLGFWFIEHAGQDYTLAVFNDGEQYAVLYDKADTHMEQAMFAFAMRQPLGTH